ncbi:MAG: DUF58 domain-containing protein [Spirochaetaceae bacterium]|nr:DUF58 domain-containing protein [Spirochaetaceae bacterium]
MISRDLAKKIRYIQISTNRAANSTFAGEYESVFKGQGIEFDEVREYQPGDDTRAIDWNVTARTGVPFIKRFVEERELIVMFLVDMSGSGVFGSIEKTKNEIAAEICSLMAFSAIKNNDKVGLIVFTDTVEFYLPPEKGTRHVLRLIEEILNFKPHGKKTDISAALDYLGRVISKKTVTFLISDYLDTGYEQKLRIMNKRHDLIAVTIKDPREIELPKLGLIKLLDSETGERIIIDTNNGKARNWYKARALERKGQLKKILASSGIDQIDIQTDQDYLKSITSFFLNRERRLKR